MLLEAGKKKCESAESLLVVSFYYRCALDNGKYIVYNHDMFRVYSQFVR